MAKQREGGGFVFFLLIISLQYAEEDDLVNVIKGFSTVTKEHTTFTDTHL